MTAKSLLRRLAGLTAAYALALHAILAGSLMATASAGTEPVGAICASSEDGNSPPAGILHDCAAACALAGCGHAAPLPTISHLIPQGSQRYPVAAPLEHQILLAVAHSPHGPRAPPRG